MKQGQEPQQEHEPQAARAHNDPIPISPSLARWLVAPL